VLFSVDTIPDSSHTQLLCATSYCCACHSFVLRWTNCLLQSNITRHIWLLAISQVLVCPKDRWILLKLL